MPVRITELGELQLAALKVLWAQPGATVHEVLAALPAGRKPAYTTILTVLRNMEKRDLVAHEQADGERTFRYRALVSEEDARNSLLQEVSERLFDGSAARLILYLLETQPLSEDELARIKRTLAGRTRPATDGKRGV